MPAKSLREHAVQSARRSISKIDDVGDLPYAHVKSILTAIVDPAQLLRLEENSPQIAGADRELWQAFIARDIQDGRNKTIPPKNPRNWGKVYYKMLKEDKKNQQESEERLLETLMGIEHKREANKVNILSTVVPQTRRKGFSGSGFGASTTRHQATPTNQAARKGQTIMDKVRKEGAASAAAHRNRFAVIRKNDQALSLARARSQITQAPASMIREHANLRAPLPVMTNPGTIARQMRPAPKIFSATARTYNPVFDTAMEQANKEKERRLLALTQTPTKPKATLVDIPSHNKVDMMHTIAPDMIKNVSHSTYGAKSQMHHDGTQDGESTHATIATQTVIRKRPAVSLFMPAKKRKV